MKREWQPGDVAVANFGGDLGVRVSRCIGGWVRLTDPDDFINDDDRYDNGEPRVTDARQIVVIDPEDRAQVERLLVDLADVELLAREPIDKYLVEHAQAALREFANPTPPKPDEPTGLGAVVEDDKGVPWVRCENVDREPHWYARNKAKDYSEITAVRILSEGVHP